MRLKHYDCALLPEHFDILTSALWQRQIWAKAVSHRHPDQLYYRVGNVLYLFGGNGARNRKAA